MKKHRLKFFELTFLTLVTISGFANESWLKDTIYVNLDETFGKFTYHKVEKKQTLFSLANAYGIDLYDVYDYNPILKSRILQANDELRMPISNDYIITDKNQLEKDKKYHPIYYIIQPKDNLYRISKVYFNMSFEDLMKRNNLTSHNIQVSQKLLIGWFDPTKKESGTPDFKPNTVKTEQANLEQKWTIANPAPFTEEYKALDLAPKDGLTKFSKEENSRNHIININPEVKEVKIKERKEEKPTISTSITPEKNVANIPSKSTPDNPNVIRPEVKGHVLKRRMVTQNGVAQWIKTDSPSSDLYVLHPTAPINSVVEITNPMTHRKIYAKVLSNMPPKLYSDEISVVVSPGVANLLGVIDSKFYVKLRYVEESFQ